MSAPAKTVAVVQSSYIPWKGYFDLIGHADEFILYDDAQFTRRDWRNRNRIKAPEGPRWLTIPVEAKGKFVQAVKDTCICDPGWSERHWRSLRHCYARAPHFRVHADFLEDLYASARQRRLSEVNHHFLRGLCGRLGIETRLSWSMDYRLEGNATERLLGLCQQAGATEYLSGPTARDYLDEGAFVAAGIRVRYMDYSGYPEYPQVFPPFVHEVSVLDLLLNTGTDARRYLKGRAGA